MADPAATITPPPLVQAVRAGPRLEALAATRTRLFGGLTSGTARVGTSSGSGGSSGGTIQRYRVSTLGQAQQAIGKSADQDGPSLLRTNAEWQKALESEKDVRGSELESVSALVPFFTTMGLEVEFAQQPEEAQRRPDNPLRQAHIVIGDSPGYALSMGIPFVLETDAQFALEFVTPPLLAPLAGNDEEEAIVPDKTWERAATKSLEHWLKSQVRTPRALASVIERLNGGLGLAFKGVGEDIAECQYGPIMKGTPKSHTSAQLNFMTSLQYYMAINARSERNEKYDKVTQGVFDLLYEGFKKQADAPDDAEARAPVIYAASQKIREIPGSIVDNVFSYILDADTRAPSEQSPTQKRWAVLANEGNREPRTELALAASHIKDQGTLWLKASLSQVLESFNSDDAFYFFQAFEALQSKLLETLMGTEQAAVLLDQGFLERGQLAAEIHERFSRIRGLGEDFHKIGRNAESDVKSRPHDQRSVNSEARTRMIGARPDTYVGSDKKLRPHGEPLYLVETRKTTRYLGFTEKDRYSPYK